MKRLARAPLLAQVLALIAAVIVLAQLISLTAIVVMPQPREPFTLVDIATALKTGAPLERQGVTLIVEPLASPPKQWALDDEEELKTRVTLAGLTGLRQDQVLVEQEVPIPGGGLLVRWNSPAIKTVRSPKPYERPDTVIFYDMIAAAERPDGSWTLVRTTPNWGAPIALIAVWLAAGLLILLPLAWIFTRMVVAPIKAFAEVAERAGRGDRRARFPATGPREVRLAAQALDDMQRRIGGAVEERTNLIAAIAHDLRSPLARLRFKAEDLPSEQRSAIVRDIERMDSMIASVLAFARGEADVERQRVDLSALVQSLVDDLAAGGAQVSMVEAMPVEVHCDALAIRRLVANLLDNAVRYGGGARCRVLRNGSQAQLLIEDDGPGIAEESLEKVLAPFVRGDASRDPATGGVGLGLAIARAIARSHGGDVSLARRAQGGLSARVELAAAS